MLKNKIFIFFLLGLSILSVSCKEEIKRVSTVSLSQSNQKTSFYINESNFTQKLEAFFYDQDGNSIKSKAEWTSNLPADTVIVSTDNTFIFDINSINLLGDYYVQVRASNDSSVNTKYVFSLLSKDSLSTSLTYSFADVSNSTLSIDDKDIVSIEQIHEYDRFGNKIYSSNQRMTLQNEINYYSSGSNFIFINFKENKNLGKIVSFFSENSSLEAYTTSDNGLIIGGEVDQDHDYTITISAGTKDSREITIHALAHSESKIADPIISDPFNSTEYDGQILRITGDSVNTSYYPIADGNTLKIKVLRKKYNSAEEYKEYFFEDNEETSEIKYGKTIHLKHAGDYIITAKLTNAVSESDIVEKKISIAPKITDQGVLTVTSLRPDEIVNSQNMWNTLSTGSVVPQDDMYKIEVNNSYETGQLVISLEQIITTGQKTCKKTILDPGESFKQNLNESGFYNIIITTKQALSGYGEIFDHDVDSDCAVITSFEIKEAEAPLELLSVSGTRTYTIDIASSLPENAVVYMALLKDGLYDSSYILSAGDQQIIENADNKLYTLKAYVFYAYNRCSSIVYEYGTETPMLQISALPSVNNSDDVQNARNQRRVQLSLTQDIYGNYRPTYYRWDDDSDWHALNRDAVVYTSAITEEGTHTLHYKVLPSEVETVTGEVETSITVKLTKLNPGLIKCQETTRKPLFGDHWYNRQFKFKASIGGATILYWYIDDNSQGSESSPTGSYSDTSWGSWIYDYECQSPLKVWFRQEKNGYITSDVYYIQVGNNTANGTFGFE